MQPTEPRVNRADARGYQGYERCEETPLPSAESGTEKTGVLSENMNSLLQRCQLRTEMR